eukprot:3686579-Pleurochrysis_carterae.AAC.4
MHNVDLFSQFLIEGCRQQHCHSPNVYGLWRRERCQQILSARAKQACSLSYTQGGLINAVCSTRATPLLQSSRELWNFRHIRKRWHQGCVEQARCVAAHRARSVLSTASVPHVLMRWRAPTRQQL